MTCYKAFCSFSFSSTILFEWADFLASSSALNVLRVGECVGMLVGVGWMCMRVGVYVSESVRNHLNRYIINYLGHNRWDGLKTGQSLSNKWCIVWHFELFFTFHVHVLIYYRNWFSLKNKNYQVIWNTRRSTPIPVWSYNFISILLLICEWNCRGGNIHSTYIGQALFDNLGHCLLAFWFLL